MLRASLRLSDDLLWITITDLEGYNFVGSMRSKRLIEPKTRLDVRFWTSPCAKPTARRVFVSRIHTHRMQATKAWPSGSVFVNQRGRAVAGNLLWLRD